MKRAPGRRPAGGAGPQPVGLPATPSVSVRQLLHEGGSLLRLHLAAGRAGLDRQIQLSRVQRPGLALTGFTDYLRYGRVQIVGGSEVSYLAKLTATRRRAILSRLAKADITCFVVTKGLAVPPELLSALPIQAEANRRIQQITKGLSKDTVETDPLVRRRIADALEKLGIKRVVGVEGGRVEDLADDLKLLDKMEIFGMDED